MEIGPIGPIFRAMGRNKIRFGLIVVEVALTLAVAANCAAMILHARREMRRPSGFDDENLIAVDARPFDTVLRDEGKLDNLLREDAQILRSTPGVRSVMNTRFLPWAGGGSSGEVKVAGKPGEMLRTQMYSTDEGLIDTLGVSLIEGRAFTPDEVERDTGRLKALFAGPRQNNPDGTPREKFLQEIVISRGLAKLAFGEGPYLGKLLEDKDTDQYRVVGVIDHFYNPYGWPIHEYAMFYANRNRSFDAGSRFLVRTEPGRAADVARALEDRLMQAGGPRELKVQKLTDVRGNFFGPQRMVAMLMGMVVVLLVLVTSLGIVGLTSFSVTERTRQIGTRRALGATTADILRYFLVENWLLTTMGLALGVVLAVGLNMTLMSVFEGAKLAPGLVVVSVVVIWMVGVGSALAPALRGARTSPAVATRNV